HPAGTELRQMADLASTLTSYAQADHLVVGPERSIHEQTVRRRHRPANDLVDLGDARGIQDAAARLPIVNHDADVVARLRSVAARRKRCGLADQGYRLQLDSIDPGDREPARIDGNAMPVDAAEMIEHRQRSGERRVGT